MIEKLKRLFDPAKKQNYKQALAAASPPIIPYLGEPQTDLVLAYDGNPLYDSNGLINMYR